MLVLAIDSHDSGNDELGTRTEFFMGGLTFYTRVLDKEASGSVHLPWFSALRRLMGRGRTLLRPVVQAVQACGGGEGEVSESGMT